MSGKTALIGICLVLLAGAAAGGYVLVERYRASREPVIERTLPPLDIGRGRGLSYTFVDTGGALQTVDARDEVPEDAREFVKVDGAAVPRSDRTASLVYVADLRAPAPGGQYAYKVMTDAQFRELVLPESSDTSMHVKYEPEPAAPAAPPPRKKARGKRAATPAAAGERLPELVRGPGPAEGVGGAGPAEEAVRQLRELQGGLGGSAPPAAAGPSPAGAPSRGSLGSGKSVILYTTQWCPACTRARSWLRARGVSFVEKDIEKDSSADQEYARKCARIGQRGGRIPGIDIDGTLMIGFAPGRVESLLRR